jgi:uncharacterized membrane-anchored protein
MHNAERKQRRSALLMLLVACQLLFLAGIAGYHYAVLWVGKDIPLQTVPIDPRDQLNGDYVQLNYRINSVDQALWRSLPSKPEPGDTVYVRLAENRSTGTYEANGVYARKPDRGNGEVVLKGRVQYAEAGRIRIVYGLEQYYVEENTGKSLEQRANHGIVHVKAAPWGNPVVDRIEP